MATRHSDNDGSDIFWPGYVDAIANLVLNLLFLLTIMTIAVFMFALELGRGSKGGSGNTPVTTKRPESISATRSNVDLDRQNLELKREIERLNKLLAQQPSKKVQNVQNSIPVKVGDTAQAVSKPLSGLDRALATAFEVVVHFKDEAVALSAAEQERLTEPLKPIAGSSRVSIVVEVPAGFSEAKRLGFYRAMAVRNLLLDMKTPKDRIDVSVVEGRSTANASIVRVTSR